MISAELAEKVTKQNLRQERVASWRLRDSVWSFITYLYWRNRFPVLNKLLVRAILLLEFYLLFVLFQSRVAVSFSLLFFCFFIARSMFSGIGQYFRVELVKAEKSKKVSLVKNLGSALLVISILYGIFISMLPFLYFLIKGASVLQLSYSGIWIILLPLDLCASSVWLAVYTKQRLRRNIWLICAFRLFPTLCLLIFHSSLGPLAYIIGVALGRTSEKVYLLRLGLSTLERRGTSPASPESGFRLLWQSFSQKFFWRYALAPQPLQIYLLVLALMLAARDPHLWMTHFAFSFLVLSLAYVPLRVSMSLFMDLFLSLKSGDIAQAKIWHNRGVSAQNLVLAILISFLILLLAQQNTGFGILSSIAYELSGYFIFILVIRTLFQGSLNFQRAAAVEPFFTIKLSILFTLTAFVQAYFIFYLRANLQAIYLLEAFCFLLAALIVSGSKRFSESPFFMEDFTEGIKKAKLLPPFLWVRAAQNLAGQRVPCSLLSLQLDARYVSQIRQERLLELVSGADHFSGIGTRVTDSLYLYLLPNFDYPQAQKIALRLQRSYGGHIRNTIALNSQDHITKSVLHVIAASSRIRRVPRRLQAVQHELRSLIKSKLFYKVEKRVTSHHFDSYNSQELLKFIEILLKENSFERLPRVSFNGTRRIQTMNPSVELLQFSSISFGSLSRVRTLLPAAKRPFAIFFIGGQPLSIVDSQPLADSKTGELYELARLASICLTLQIIKCGSAEQELPGEVSDLLEACR